MVLTSAAANIGAMQQVQTVNTNLQTLKTTRRANKEKTLSVKTLPPRAYFLINLQGLKYLVRNVDDESGSLPGRGINFNSSF